MKGNKEIVKHYEGLYWNVEKPRDTLDKLEVLMSDGLVRVKGNEEMGDYIETEPEVFQKVNLSLKALLVIPILL